MERTEFHRPQRSVLASLPAWILKKLNATDLKVLEILAQMIGNRSKHKPALSPFVESGQRWIAWRLGSARETVNKSIKKLDLLGLLSHFRRRKENGRWKTCIYRLGHVLLMIWQRSKEALRAALLHVTSTSHIVGKPTHKGSSNSLKEEDSYKNNSPPIPDNDLMPYLRQLSIKLGYAE